MSHLDALITAPGPKKLLAIDGGGIRGLIAVEFVARIEALLRAEFGDPNLVLAQYFDYMAGTSTGAIIATLLSLGYDAARIRDFYKTGGKTMFQPNSFQRLARRTRGRVALFLGGIGLYIYRAMYKPNELEQEIRQVLGDPPPGAANSDHPVTTLGTDKLQTLLMVVTRNASTDSPWPLSNNPNAKYNLRRNDDGKMQASNLDVPLWQVIRASTAAPVFFPPESVTIPGSEKPFMFMDGGVTVYNNPAFQLFLMATLPAYRLKWRAGEENLLLISVGTGLCESEDLNLRQHEMNLLYNMQSTPAALMRAATVEQDILCRVFGRASDGCHPPEIDREIGPLVGHDAPLREKLFTYARYNVELSSKGLAALELGDIDPKMVQPLDSVDHLGALEHVGNAAASRCVSISHFGGFLDRAALRPRKAPPLRSA